MTCFNRVFRVIDSSGRERIDCKPICEPRQRCPDGSDGSGNGSLSGNGNGSVGGRRGGGNAIWNRGVNRSCRRGKGAGSRGNKNGTRTRRKRGGGGRNESGSGHCIYVWICKHFTRVQLLSPTDR